MSGLAKNGIEKIKPYEPGKPIEEVKRQLGLRRVYKLASNENPLGPSPRALGAIKKALKDLNRYPDGSCYYLKMKLAKKLKLDPKNLIIGNGSDEIISIIMLAFLNRGEEVIVSEPTFLEYRLISEAFGAGVKAVANINFKYDLDGMKRVVSDKTKVIFIANPDNPTGTYVTGAELKGFLDGISENVLVVIDEAYREFVNFKDYPQTEGYLETKNVIILRTFSKAYGLAGLRVGYGLGKAELIDCMNRVRQPFNVNALAQAAASASLDDRAHIRKTKAAVSKGKRFLYHSLDRLRLAYVPSATNFVLIDIGRDGREVFEEMLRYGVIVRDMKPYGLDKHIRVTIGKAKENEKFIGVLKKLLR